MQQESNRKPHTFTTKVKRTHSPSLAMCGAFLYNANVKFCARVMMIA